ncbi:TolC family protein [Marinobacter daepoensis]|uniref:TolC family protein n=1 Tax=Marinobacter daepoensis TaxID=262077 RepID=A0ABS3BBA4_9GAMM|nr:TolC family protein [Marinobacter daepoensis]MBN7769134.1 TolC family protein [Marinobacter daepoensis]MBY6077824.1 TolC family protein [Marinobacter daepoensis]
MHLRSLTLLSILLLSGCASFEPQPIEYEMETPGSWAIESGAAQSVGTRWWEGFHDPRLNQLVDRALANNPTLAVTAQSIRQADLQLKNAGAALLPSIEASGNTGKQTSKAPGMERQSGGTSSLGLSVSYELDFWGRLTAAEASALATFKATERDYDVARMTLAASVASTWFEWQELRQRADIARKNLALGERTLTLVDARYRNGVADRSELSRQKTSVLSLRNALPPLEYQARQRLAALRILTGDYPFTDDLPESRFGQVQVPLIDPGTPASLVSRRPDLAAKEHRLAAASADIAQARAALLPAVSLTGAVRLSTDAFLSLSDPLGTASGLLGLSQTLFDGGQRRHSVALSESRRIALLEEYRAALLVAFQEVGDALDRGSLYLAEEQRLQAILVQAKETLQLTEIRYREGADDLLALLASQRAVFDARQQLSQVRLNRLIAAVDLYKALGGGWQAGLPETAKARAEEVVHPQGSRPG